MDDPVIINSIDRVDHLHSLVRQDLRDLGVKLPKSKKLKKFNQSRSISHSQDEVFSKVFGEPLCQVPATFIPEYGYVPHFLIDAAKVVEKHIESEGLFRKSGSVGRQKELKIAVDDGRPVEGTSIHDVTSLIKQFFRELPEPLFMTLYHDAFIRCYQLSPDKDPKKALLNICLLLPIENIGALRFTMHMLSKVAAKSDKNKMTANNLAVVMTPNLMHGNKGTQKMSSAEEKLIHIQTCIIELLIKNWELVGMVGTSLRQQLNMMSECFGTDDDLDASDDNTLEDSKDISHKKKRKRSGSLTGFVSSIAQGFAKLRRSTDGKINMSSNSTYRAELSLASNTSANQSQEISLSSATPCVMRKRRASGDAVPFSASKKQAILGHLPQKSALASTPFTPASTIKKHRHHHDDNCCISPHLNATTPALGSKTPRKKLNLFSSPGSNKKIKRQNSMSIRKESPAPKGKSSKGKSIFRRLSGSRTEKESQVSAEHIGERLATSINPSPKSTHSDSALQEQKSKLSRSLSSPSLQESDQTMFIVVDDQVSFDQGFVYEPDVPEYSLAQQQDDSVFIRETRGRSEERMDADGVRYPGRSKSVDSPGIRRGQPNSICNGLLNGDSAQLPKLKGKLDKSAISDPSPIIVPVLVNAVDVKADSEFRRSRKDEFEREKFRRSTQKDGSRKNAKRDDDHRPKIQNHFKSGQDLDKSISSHLDASLMQAVLPPPHGFGDETMMEQKGSLHPHRAHDNRTDDEDEDVEIDVESDAESEAGFSTISGGTVMRRTESGHYTRLSSHSASGSSIVSSVSCNSVMKPPKPVALSLQASGSIDSLLSVGSQASHQSTISVSSLGRSVSSDSGKGSLLGEVGDDGHAAEHGRQEDTYVTLRSSSHSHHPVEGDYVILRHHNHTRTTKPELETSRGMKLLYENYESASEEDSSSSTKYVSTSEGMESRHNVSIGSHQEDLENMPRKTDVHRKKSISAEDLQAGAKISLPVRAHSVHLSPGKKFNYKPHLEISRETHNLLARAGYFPPSENTSNSTDVQVPVKSPKRSSHREEMMTTLRSSFHERHGRLNASIRSKRSLSGSSDRSTVQNRSTAANTSISSDCEKLSLSNQDSVDAKTSDKHDTGRLDEQVGDSELKRKVSEISANIEKLDEERRNSTEPDESLENLDNDIEIEDEIDIESTPQTDIKHEDELLTELEAKDSSMPSTEPKSLKKMKASEKFLTLSGFLDKEIAGHVQIKRAEMTLPKHDSVLRIQQAGLVAQSVRQFSQRQHSGRSHKFAMPAANKRGTSPVRIPTIFAKSDEKVQHYKEIAQFIRERTGSKDFMSLPAVPKTPGKQNGEDEVSDLSDESVSEENITVVEANAAKKPSSSYMTHQKSVSQSSMSELKVTDPLSCPQVRHTDHVPPSLSTPSMKGHIELSESLMETIHDVCTPRSQKYLTSSHEEKEHLKSPLLESTNTATDLAENVKLRTSNGSLHVDKSYGRPQTPASLRPHKTQLKRLKNNNSPRKHNSRSPRRRPQSPHHAGAHSSGYCSNESLQIFTPVPIQIDDETSQ